MAHPARADVDIDAFLALFSTTGAGIAKVIGDKFYGVAAMEEFITLITDAFGKQGVDGIDIATQTHFRAAVILGNHSGISLG